MNVRMSVRARRDLEDIYDYIAADNPDAAFRVVDHILKAVAALGEHPRLGRQSNFRGRRELIVGNYIVTYAIRSSGIGVEAVTHGARRGG